MANIEQNEMRIGDRHAEEVWEEVAIQELPIPDRDVREIRRALQALRRRIEEDLRFLQGGRRTNRASMRISAGG